ncbi:MAG: hypothetical protein QUS07_07055 [Methanothrix sp.]|nr:hypothetical protein [Methanothrix sp.]
MRGIRCGYVTVQFENKEAHAIVAFETDYGLTYFEPQTGDQEYLEIGKPYGANLDGVPSDCPIAGISIEWNDKMKLRFVTCEYDHYLWPVRHDEQYPITCPLCGG